MCTAAWEFYCIGYTYYNGHRVWEDQDGHFRYFTDDTSIREDPYRACPLCGSEPTPEKHDACLGTLPNVLFACCGHSVIDMAYVKLEDERIMRGYHALLYFSRQGVTVGYPWVVWTRDRGPWWECIAKWKKARHLGLLPVPRPSD